MLHLRDDRLEKMDFFRPRTDLRMAKGGPGRGSETEMKGGGDVNTQVMASDLVGLLGSVNPNGVVGGGSRQEVVSLVSHCIVIEVGKLLGVSLGAKEAEVS